MTEVFAVTLTSIPHDSRSWNETVEAFRSEVASHKAIREFVSRCTRNCCEFGHPWFEGRTSAVIRYQVFAPSGEMINSGNVWVENLPQGDCE